MPSTSNAIADRVQGVAGLLVHRDFVLVPAHRPARPAGRGRRRSGRTTGRAGRSGHGSSRIGVTLSGPRARCPRPRAAASSRRRGRRGSGSGSPLPLGHAVLALERGIGTQPADGGWCAPCRRQPGAHVVTEVDEQRLAGAPTAGRSDHDARLLEQQMRADPLPRFAQPVARSTGADGASTCVLQRSRAELRDVAAASSSPDAVRGQQQRRGARQRGGAGRARAIAGPAMPA